MSDKKETTNLDVLDVLYRALQTQKQVMLDHKHKADGKFDEEIEDVEYDGDNHDGTIQLTLKDGTVWFISSNDIKQDSELIRDK